MAGDRYSRQQIIPGIGVRGQMMLSRASVFVVGCGGLGSTLLYDLAGLGVSRLGFTDADVVSESDLNRQFLHSTAEIGMPKTASAMRRLTAFNPTIAYEPHDMLLTDDNAAALLAGYDVIALAVDNIAARLSANAYCARVGVPLVNGGVDGFSGSMTVAFPHRPPCLACLYRGTQDTKRSVGSFAPVVTAVAAFEAQAIALLLLGKAEPLYGGMYLYDGTSMELTRASLRPAPDCQICGH